MAIYMNEFTVGFRDCCQLWRNYFEARLQSTGQSITRSRAILYLADTAVELSQKDLARLLNIEEPSVARMLVGMEKSGLIERRRSAYDRRINYIKLTAAATPVVAEIKLIAGKACMDGLQGIPEDKLRIAQEVMQAISKNIS